MHAGQPPASGKRRLLRIAHVDHRQHVIDEAVEMHRDISVAAADPPDAVRAEAGHIEEGDFARVRRIGNVEDAQARGKGLLGMHRVGERLRVVGLLALILLHGPDIGPVHGEQDVAVDLQVMRAGVLRRGDEGDRFRLQGIAHVDHGKAVAEHVADKGVAFGQDHLNAVRAPALIVAREKADILGRRGFGVVHGGA